MRVQVLVVTMNQKQNDYSLLDKMNIQTDAIVGNQCDRNEVVEFERNDRKIKWLSFAERGVGLNRNNTLMRANADIILFADDDVVYCNDYEKVISDFYETHNDADVVIFNFMVKRGDSPYKKIVNKTKKVSWKGVTSFGTYCISARNNAIKKKNIYFNREFGGGSLYSHGEDTLFLHDCIKSGLTVYTCESIIGSVDHGQSTWFVGYNERILSDTGIVYYTMMGNMAVPAAIYHCYKHKGLYSEIGWKKALRYVMNGINAARKR